MFYAAFIDGYCFYSETASRLHAHLVSTGRVRPSELLAFAQLWAGDIGAHCLDYVNVDNLPPTLSPELIGRIHALEGCRGQWLVDLSEFDYSIPYREGESLPNVLGGDSYYWQPPEGCDLKGPYLMALFCAATHWKARLGFSHDYLNADASWPGGYDAPSVYLSNNRVFKEDYPKVVEQADLGLDGLTLDVRYLTDDAIEAIVSLEDYPLLSEDDHSYLELELQDEEWERWAKSEFTDTLRNHLGQYDSDNLPPYWWDDVVDDLPNDYVGELFHDLMERTNTYWVEEPCSGYWVDFKRLAAGLTFRDTVEIMRESIANTKLVGV